MNKEIIIYGAVILSFIHIIYEVFKRINELRKDIPEGCSCVKLENEKCSVYIWNKLIFQKESFCNREKCPGFTYCKNGNYIRKISIWSVLEIIIQQALALSTLVLLFLQIIN